MASRRTVLILACLPLAGCTTTHADSTDLVQPTSTASPSPAAETTHSWQPGTAPQPVTRLNASTTSAPPTPAHVTTAPPAAPAQPPAAPAPNPKPQVATVTVHAPAPRPAPAPAPRPHFHFDVPAPPKVPTEIPVPPEVQKGIDQIPTLPPLPRAEDIYFDVPF